MSSNDEITLRRILRLEEELDQLRTLVTAPTTILTALEADRREWQAGFADVGRRLGSVDDRLGAIEAALTKIANALKGTVPPSAPPPPAGGTTEHDPK